MDEVSKIQSMENCSNKKKIQEKGKNKRDGECVV